MKGFKLSNSVSNFLSDAVNLFQLGADVATMIQADQEKQESFIPKRKYNFDSSLRSARPTPQTMEAPIGIRPPNLQAAARFFANNTAKDTNLASLQASSYRAGMSRKRQNVNPNFSTGSFGTTGSGTSARSNRVSRARFRSFLSS